MNASVELESEFSIEVHDVVRGSAPYSIADLRRALNEDNGTVTHLQLSFIHCDPTGDQGFLRFLLQYVATRKHLRKLTLYNTCCSRIEMLDFFRQFVLAAVRSETIYHLCLSHAWFILVLDLNVVLRAERTNIKILELRSLHFGSNDDAAAPAWQAQQDTTTTLDKLVLSQVTFNSRQEALMFEEIVQRLSISDLEITGLICYPVDDDDAILKRIVTALIKSPIKRLELHTIFFPIELVHTALAAGVLELEELKVDIHFFPDAHKAVVDAISNMAHLRVLRITFDSGLRSAVQPTAKQLLLRAINANATLTEIHVDIGGTGHIFSPEDLHLMRLLRDGRTQRNSALARFVQNPSQLSQKEVLVLMLQLENCPSGSYELVRKLPELGNKYFHQCNYESIEPDDCAEGDHAASVSWNASSSRDSMPALPPTPLFRESSESRMVVQHGSGKKIIPVVARALSSESVVASSLTGTPQSRPPRAQLEP